MKTINYIITAVAILVVIFLVNRLRVKTNEVDRYKENVTALHSEIIHYETKSGKDAATIKSLTVTSKEIKNNLYVANKNLDELKQEFKKVKSTLTILQNAKIDTVKVPFKVIVPCKFKIQDSLKTKHYSFTYFINQNGFRITNFKLLNEINIVSGLKTERKGWFKTVVIPTTAVSNTNPYIKIEKIISQQPVEIKDRSYQWGVPVGFILGFLLAK